ncbi:MAG: hypothetical protein KKB39_04110 [Nanoarchaeota archaeon]|nr:hypothetical protein [Nanoarchaeota archaeon]
MKLKLLIGVLALGTITLAYFGPENSYHEARSLLEKNEVAEVKVGQLEKGCYNTNEEFLETDKPACFKWNADGLKLKSLKLTLNDKLIAKADIKETEDKKILTITNHKGKQIKEFPKNVQGLPLSYSGIIENQKGKHILRLYGKDVQGNSFQDEAYLKFKEEK